MYISTRGEKERVTASKAILRGLAPDGGLYVPETIPEIDFTPDDITGWTYQQLAYRVLKLYLDDFTDDEIKTCVNKAYDEKFDDPSIAPLEICDNNYFLELFHGKTIAFKDMALSILPYLLTKSAEKNGLKEEVVILTATSGDTGKAALEGFADVKGTKIIVFYPEQGVSEIQKRQMTTQVGGNTFVAAVKGNFDDTQTGVKNIFSDKKFAGLLKGKGYCLSSANSINIGRLVPQIVYYFYAYGQLLSGKHIESGEIVDFTVPTGNFGNILAGWYAKKMGLPIGTLICASNDNKVLYDFFATGIYDVHRRFLTTISPSMDILISSNLERLLFHLSGDGSKVKELMQKLTEKGVYNFSTDEIHGEYASESEVLTAIKELYSKKRYIMDTHTAVAYCAAKKYGGEAKNVIISTASPFKFTEAVCSAINKKNKGRDAFELLGVLAKLNGSDIPEQIKGIGDRTVLHKTLCGKDEMKKTVEAFLKL